MKLYSQEQVKEAMIKYASPIRPLAEQVINSLTPIELPSDEEIKEYFSWGYGGDSGSAIYGAKWMKDKILNQNK